MKCQYGKGMAQLLLFLLWGELRRSCKSLLKTEGSQRAGLRVTGEKLNNEEKQRFRAGSVAAERVEVLLKEVSAGGLGGRYTEKAGNVGDGGCLGRRKMGKLLF